MANLSYIQGTINYFDSLCDKAVLTERDKYRGKVRLMLTAEQMGSQGKEVLLLTEHIDRGDIETVREILMERLSPHANTISTICAVCSGAMGIIDDQEYTITYQCSECGETLTVHK